MTESAWGGPVAVKRTCWMKLEPKTMSGAPSTWPGVITFSTPSWPSEPWIGICSPPRVTFWMSDSGAFSGMFALRSARTARPKASRTAELPESSELGVCTGSLGSKGTRHGSFSTPCPFSRKAQ